MRTITYITTTLIISLLIMGSGCRSKKTGYTVSGDGSDYVVPGHIYGEDGFPLTGEPFDLTRQRLEGIDLAPVYFGYDSFVLAPQEVSKLQTVADYLHQNRNIVLIVEGHCDERGSNEYNLSLGEQRALTLRSYLINLGIDADRIQSRSFGEERPAVLGTGEAAWRLNRRGEFALYQ
jgi:peptidoglycan-associated lipoprotein